ncbi:MULTISPECIES: phage tail tube protein [unclassified Streptomyces]|uniref:phage tail tube protein n=1 Tax=Streptomyces sp. 021-4 TaxID=2789260 RepID=UPI0039F5F2B3
MPLNANAVRVALSGAAYVGPPDTEGPTDSTTNWPEAVTDIGWISDDGITESNSADTTEIKGWQGGQTVRKVISSSEMTFQFTAIETSKTVLELYHKGSKVVTTSGKSVLAIKAPGPDRRFFGFDVIDGNSHVRIVIPDGEVSETGDITYKGDEAIAYELTITAYPGPDGTVAYKYSNDPAWASAPEQPAE